MELEYIVCLFVFQTCPSQVVLVHLPQLSKTSARSEDEMWLCFKSRLWCFLMHLRLNSRPRLVKRLLAMEFPELLDLLLLP